MNLKYNGWYPLLVAGGMLFWELAIPLLNRDLRRETWSQRLDLVWGTLEMQLVAIALYTPWLLHVQAVVGLRALETQISAYSVSQGPLVKTPPDILLGYLALFTSTPVMWLAGAGAVVSVLRHRAEDRLLLIYTAGLVALLMLYVAYPHLGYPLIYPIAIWAGVGVDALARLGAATSRRPQWAVALAAVLALALAASELPRDPAVVTANTLGYAQAGELVNQLHDQAPVLTAIQANGQLYIDGAVNYSLDGSQLVADVLARPGRKYIIVDQTVSWDARNAQFMDDNRNRLNLVERIPNPMYDEVFMEPAYANKFAQVDAQPDVFRYIYVYSTDAALTIPDNWKVQPAG
jgi:hypothetical protein